jgi:hypothetical protein
MMKRGHDVESAPEPAPKFALVARAQQQGLPVIGFLSSSALADRARYLPA